MVTRPRRQQSFKLECTTKLHTNNEMQRSTEGVGQKLVEVVE